MQGKERVAELLKRAGLGGVPPGAALALGVAAAAAFAWAAWRWGVAPGGDTFESADSAVATATAAAGATSSATVAGLTVHVVGAVRRPGVYELPAGSRVRDVIEAAGGVLGEGAPDAINLARLIQDGEQIAVPTKDEVAAGAGGAAAAGVPGSAGAGSPAATGKININTADAAALDALPGVGPSTAAKIVADREANGPFASADDLARVPGIGAKKLDAMRDMVTVR